MKPPPAKRMKFIKKYTNNHKKWIKITDLNEHCLLNIMKWLPKEDLKSIGQTCKLLERYSGLQYERDYPKDLVNMELFCEDEVQCIFDSDYGIFGPYIQKALISSYIFDFNPMPLFKDMNTYFEVCLKELSLARLDCTLITPGYGLVIQDHLANLETISFSQIVVSDYHIQFLQYCENLKHLRINHKSIHGETSLNSMVEKKYPHLKSLTYWCRDNNDYTPFASFIENNHIKYINCMGINFINAMLSAAIDLENLVVHLEHHEDLKPITYMLYKHRKQFKRLEIVFHYVDTHNFEHIKLLSCLSHLEGFHGYFNMDTIIIDALKSMTNLRTLSLILSLNDATELRSIVEHLPFLQTVCIYVRSTYQFGENFLPLTMPFIENQKQLSRMIVYFKPNSCHAQPKDIIDLNIARIKLNDAFVTTIYLENDIISKFILPTGGLVRIKPIIQWPNDRLYSDPFSFFH